MYPFTDKAKTTKYSKWTNTCRYIILHHTAGWTYQSNLKYLSSSSAQASVQFIVWPNEEVAKIWEPNMCMRHAWTSERWTLSWMNKYSMWIEIVWFWDYNTKQLIRVTDLVEYLMAAYNIPKENVLRHSDICQHWDYSKKKILWDWKRWTRKIDVWLKFFPMWFEAWRNQLTPRKESRYGSI